MTSLVLSPTPIGREIMNDKANAATPANATISKFGPKPYAGIAGSLVTYNYDIIVNLPDNMEEHIHGKCDRPGMMFQAIEEYCPDCTSAVVTFTKGRAELVEREQS